MRGVIVNILLIFEKVPPQNAISVAIKWGGGIIKTLINFQIACPFCLVSLATNWEILCFYFLHIAPWKSQETTAREGEKWALTCGSRVRWRVGFIDACRVSFTLSKHCLCHYNGAWLAFVSITLIAAQKRHTVAFLFAHPWSRVGSCHKKSQN